VEDDRALAEFCRAEWPRLLGSLSLDVGSRELAEDLAPRVRSVPSTSTAPARSQLRDALATLPTAQRQALILRYFADLSVRDIAAAMRCPESSWSNGSAATTPRSHNARQSRTPTPSAMERSFEGPSARSSHWAGSSAR
jgi:hypothetical protein